MAWSRRRSGKTGGPPSAASRPLQGTRRDEAALPAPAALPLGLGGRYALPVVTPIASPVRELPPGVPVIIPVYRSQDHLLDLVAQLGPSLQAPGCDYEVILVNDHTPDGSWAA